MAHDNIYRALVDAVTSGKLTEPFSASDVRHVWPGYRKHAYRAFLRQRSGTHAKDIVLLEQVRQGRFRLVRPLLSGL